MHVSGCFVSWYEIAEDPDFLVVGFFVFFFLMEVFYLNTQRFCPKMPSVFSHPFLNSLGIQSPMCLCMLHLLFPRAQKN